MRITLFLASIGENTELNFYGTLLALLLSGLLFLDGYRSLRNGDRQGAQNWQALGLIVLLIYAGAAVHYRVWTGLILVALGISVEIWLILYWRRSNTG